MDLIKSLLNMDYTKEEFEGLGYRHVKQLPDGCWVGIIDLAFTTAICIDLNETGYLYRFCFKEEEMAISALTKMQSAEEVPIGWIACRPPTRLPQPCMHSNTARWGINFAGI